MRARRGISPLIATIILIAITVAGGLLIYSMFLSTGSIWGAKGQVAVENVKLVKDSSGSVLFSITLKNTGNKPVQSLTVKLAGQKVDWNFTGTLQPGQSTSFVGDAPAITGDYIIGNSYTVAIEAEFTDKSTFADTLTVVCTSA
ncbi:archaellin/type IV pilin N-terminal domain-containing protein [Thermofilum sp.]|uniref:archaellin/type IV pilin N-terminal domain-containing protein n=1 Tax=Thermofilum sp. TaxID=1961369 RepID=UPI003164539D